MHFNLMSNLTICIVIFLLYRCKISLCAPASILEGLVKDFNKFSESDSDSEQVENNSTGNDGPTATLDFLRKFGYLEPLDSNSSETLYSEERISTAIREMQRFGALPETGQLDSDTLLLLKKPRCGVPDVVHSRSKRYAFGSKGWNKRLLTYRIENWSPKLSEAEVSQDLQKALKVWADYANLRFVKKSQDADAVDIAISFSRGYHGDGYAFDGLGGTLAHAFFPQNTGGLGGDVHFDEDEPWYSPSSNSVSDGNTNNGLGRRSRGISFLDVAVHELGHSLGLAHSHVPTSVMFPYYQTPESDREPTLGQDDIMALYELYIVRHIEDNHEFHPEPTPMTPSGSSTTRITKRPWTTRSTTTISSSPDFPLSTESTGFNPFTTDIPRTSTPNNGDKDTTTAGVPDLCKEGFDTIAFLRDEIFVFKNEYMWRFKKRGQPSPGGYPVKTSRLFPVLKGVSRIDAAFERENDGTIIFISGKFYWTFDGTMEGNSGPHPLTNYGLPDSLDKIDAGFVWGKNRATYFFRDNQYWKYNDTIKGLSDGYPKDIGSWRGVPDSLTSVIRYKNDKTFFFKDNEFWSFDDIAIHTDDGFPMKTSQIWFNC